MTVGELLGRVTSHELTEWAVYFEVSAFRQKMAAEVARQRQG